MAHLEPHQGNLVVLKLSLDKILYIFSIFNQICLTHIFVDRRRASPRRAIERH